MGPEAETAIRYLMACYQTFGDSGRIDDLVRHFTADGILETPLWSAKGHGEIAAALRSGVSLGVKRPRFVRHHLTTSCLSAVAPTSASGRSYFLVMTDIGLDHAGVYSDSFELIEGRWLFARRAVSIDWKAEDSLFANQRIGKPISIDTASAGSAARPRD